MQHNDQTDMQVCSNVKPVGPPLITCTWQGYNEDEVEEPSLLESLQPAEAIVSDNSDSDSDSDNDIESGSTRTVLNARALSRTSTKDLKDQVNAAARLRIATNRPYHHGTHYSSSGTVLHYMLRLQPYSSAAVKFQG